MPIDPILLLLLSKLKISKVTIINTATTPKNTMYEINDECGRKNDSVSFIFSSPYTCPKVRGPEPNKASKKVGLYLAENIAQSSDLFSRKEIVLNTPKIIENIVFSL